MNEDDDEIQVSPLHELIGKVIKKVCISRDKERIEFTTSDNMVFTYEIDAECCSDGWIEHIEDTKDIIDEIVVDIIQYPTDGFDTKFFLRKPDDSLEYTQLYRTEIKSKKGSCILEYRNESNGYYGSTLKRI